MSGAGCSRASFDNLQVERRARGIDQHKTASMKGDMKENPLLVPGTSGGVWVGKDCVIPKQAAWCGR
jgi:hypothetical protein